MDLWTLLADIVVLLAASLLLGGVATRLGQSPLIGYLLAGMLLGGPGSIHVVQSKQEIEGIAELGVALLLFSLGLEFSLERLKKLGPWPLAGGVLQVTLTILLGAGCGLLAGLSVRESIALGTMISLSSTAIVLRILMERAELEMPHGRNALAVLLTQDMAVVPLALLMTLLGGDGGATEVAMHVGKLLLLVAALTVGLYLLNKIAIEALGMLTLYHNRELTVLFAVVTGLGSAWASHSVGISPALGAFVAGMFLGSSVFATQIRADVSSLRVILLTLFFGAAGMVANPIWIVQHWYIVAGVTALLTIGKMVLIWAIFRLLGQSSRIASATGICLAQIGEFAFVLGSVGRASGVVPDDLYALIVSVTIVSFFLSAVLVPRAPRLGSALVSLFAKDAAQVEETQTAPRVPEVVLIGFGPAGQIAAQPFVDRDKRVLVLDLNRQGVRLAQELGFQGEIGDATQSEVLQHAQLMQAEIVVITVPHFRSAMQILENVRQLAPQAHVVVRSRHQLDTDDFVSAGAHVVVGDEEQVGKCLASHVQQWLDSPHKTSPEYFI